MARGGDTDWVAEIGRGNISPVWALHGPEKLLIDRVVLALRDALVPPALRAFNYDVFDAAERPDVGRIASAAKTLPMMGKKRLVHVKSVDALKAADLETLQPVVENPQPETVLLLVGDKIDARLKFFAQVKKKGVLEKFEPPYENQLPMWIDREARARQLNLAPGTAQRLADVVGRDLGRLASSLELLGLYAGPGNPIKADDVDELIADARERNVFELCDAVYGGQRTRALTALRRMIEGRESTIGMVAMLARHARQLLRIRALGPNPSPSEVASGLGLAPFFARPLAEQARRFTEAGLSRALVALADADQDLKGPVKAALGEDLVMERLLDVVGGAATRR